MQEIRNIWWSLSRRQYDNPGFSLVDILQPCVSFDQTHTYAWYQERVYQLLKNYNPADKIAAFHKAEEWGDTIPLGILFKKERPAYEMLHPALKHGPLLSQKTDIAALEKVLDEFM